MRVKNPCRTELAISEKPVPEEVFVLYTPCMKNNSWPVPAENPDERFRYV